MAKKSAGPKEQQLREIREGKRSGSITNTDTLFDVGAYEAELTALREKHTTGLKAAIEAARTQRDEAEVALTNLERQLDKVLGRVSHVASTAPKGKGTRTRMTEADKTAFMEAATKFISGAKGVSRSQIAEHLGLELPKASTIIGALKEAKQIKTEGEKAATKYFAV